MRLEPGTTLDRYRLESKIGEGGMGVVWKAHDTTLGRAVALKFLPETLAQDAERIARFEREARVLASLRHPGIAAIHGFESAGDTRFLVMELAEGETLALRLAGGPLPVPDAIDLGLRIAAALEAAHDRGIVHRDLKPQNIQVGPDGEVKLLDFGLARVWEADDSGAGARSAADSPTISAALTSPAILLGTAAYMSPEQARGRPVDRRADIWAFGVVLFEALTGRPLFVGDTVTDTLASVLRHEIPWRGLPAATPPALRALLERCLERDPRQRLRDIGEARIALERIARGGAETGVTAGGGMPASRGLDRRRWGAALLAALVVGAIAAWALLRAMDGRDGPGDSRFSRRFALPDPTLAVRTSPVISPDGSAVAYLGDGAIWLQALDQLEPRRLASEPEATRLFWSPDSKWIGFLAVDRIGKVSVIDGTTRVIVRTGEKFVAGSGATWSRDGRIVASHATTGGLFEVSDAGGDPRPLVRPDSSAGEGDFHEPSLLPEGRGVVFVVHGRRGEDSIVLFDGKRRTTLLQLPGQTLGHPVYAPSGHLLFEREADSWSLWAVPFDLARGRVTGDPVQVVEGAMQPSLSNEGSLVYSVRGEGAVRTAWVDRTGAVIDTLGGPIRGHRGMFDLAPDGHTAVHMLNGEGGSDLWIVDGRRDTRTRLHSVEGEAFPTWSTNGTHVAYQVAPRVPAPSYLAWALAMRRADGIGRPDTLDAQGAYSPTFPPDGRSILYGRITPSGGRELVLRPLAGGEVTTIFQGSTNPYSARVSPDGRWLAYAESPVGDLADSDIYVCRFPGGEGRWKISSDGGTWPRWSPSGDRIFYVHRDDIVEVVVGPGDPPEFGRPTRLFTRVPTGIAMRFGWTPWFVAGKDRFLVLVPAAGGPGDESIVVWQNWAGALAAER